MALFYSTESDVRALTPDMAKVKALGVFAFIATAPADPGLSPGADFVSRFFAPGAGVAEDPVTGSAHCTLVPYWANRLGQDDARGASGLQTRRRAHVRAERRPRADDRPCGLLPRRHHYHLTRRRASAQALLRSKVMSSRSGGPKAHVGAPWLLPLLLALFLSFRLSARLIYQTLWLRLLCAGVRRNGLRGQYRAGELHERARHRKPAGPVFGRRAHEVSTPPCSASAEVVCRASPRCSTPWALDAVTRLYLAWYPSLAGNLGQLTLRFASCCRSRVLLVPTVLMGVHAAARAEIRAGWQP